MFRTYLQVRQVVGELRQVGDGKQAVQQGHGSLRQTSVHTNLRLHGALRVLPRIRLGQQSAAYTVGGRFPGLAGRG